MIRFVRRALLFCMLANANAICNAQTREIDSLLVLLKQTGQDTSRAFYYNRLAFRYININTDSASLYAHRSIRLSTDLDYQRGIASGHNNLGLLATAGAKYQVAIGHYDKMLEITKSIDDPRGVRMAFNNLSSVYKNLGDYPKALDYLHQSLELKLKHNATHELGPTYGNMGVIYNLLGDYPKALEYLIKAVDAKKQSNQQKGLPTTYISIGNVYRNMGDDEHARRYFEEALKISDATGNKKSIARAYLKIGMLLEEKDSLDHALNYYKKSLAINKALERPVSNLFDHMAVGDIYRKKNKFDSAWHHYRKARSIAQKSNHTRGHGEILRKFAELNFEKENYSEALSYAEEALRKFRKVGFKLGISKISRIIYQVYDEYGDYKQAFHYLKIHKAYNDSLLDESKVAELSKLQSKFRIDQIDHTNQLLTKENELKEVQLAQKETEIRTQRTLTIYALLALGLTIIGLHVIYRFYRGRKKAHIQLQQLHEDIVAQNEKIASQARELARANEEIKKINDSLEKTVDKRTKKIKEQNEKLKEYAFSNSHQVRAPLTRLMGLIDIYSKPGANLEELNNANQMIADAAKELDQIIRKINSSLDKIID